MARKKKKTLKEEIIEDLKNGSQGGICKTCNNTKLAVYIKKYLDVAAKMQAEGDIGPVIIARLGARLEKKFPTHKLNIGSLRRHIKVCVEHQARINSRG